MRSRLTGWALALFAVGALLQSCTDDPIGVGPEDAPPPAAPSFAVSGSDGTVYLPIPGANIAAGFGALDWMNVAPYTTRDFVYAEITGTVTATVIACSSPDGGTWGPWGNWGVNSSFRANMRFSTGGAGVVGAGTSVMKIYGKPGANGYLQASRSGGGATCTDGEGGQQAGLALSSAQEAQFEVYPVAQVSASPGYVPQGDSIDFTAESHWTFTNIEWRYVAGDTTASPSGGRWGQSACSGSLACAFAPTASGRMYLRGKIFGIDVEQAAPITWIGDPPPLDLVLSCDPESVTRGAVVSCEVRNVGAGAELNGADLEWKFFPEVHKVWPAATSLTLIADTVAAPNADSLWVGKVVRAGTVQIVGVRDSVADTASVQIAVVDRNWGQPGASWVGRTYPNLPAPSPSAESFTGGQTFFYPDPSDDVIADYMTGSYHLSTIFDGGPNEGYSYVVDATFGTQRAYVLNEWVVPEGPFYTMSGQDSLNTWDYVDQSYDPAVALNMIVSHEFGHKTAYESRLASLSGCGNVVAALERVAGRPDLASWQASSAVTYAVQVLYWSSGHKYVYGYITGNPEVAEWKQGMTPAIANVASDLMDQNNGGREVPDWSVCDASLY